MGSRGPVPKRDVERRRHEKPKVSRDTILISGSIKPPACPEDMHPLAQDWYNSLADSGQSKFYEPSDWQEARVLAAVLSKALNAGRPSAQLIGLWLQGATQLLTTEGARRRMRLEIERGKIEAPVSDMEAYRRAKSG